MPRAGNGLRNASSVRPFWQWWILALWYGAILALLTAVIGGCDSGVGVSGQDSDPVMQDYALAYVKRPVPFDNDVRRPETFVPGAVLYLKQRAVPSATPRDISSAAFADESFLNEDGELLYDVRDLTVSPDGLKLLFALRAPQPEGGASPSTWNIWEYRRDTGELRRVISSDAVADAGHDIGPQYLPDGRIVFSSTRQKGGRAVLRDEGKRQFSALEESRQGPAFLLHTMDAEGNDIRQITFNQSHDLDPSVLADGHIVFTRWDQAGTVDGMNLYRVRPDGSGLQLLYGRHSHDSGTNGSPVQFLQPQELTGGDILVQLRDYVTDQYEFVPTRVRIATHTDFDVSHTGDSDAGQIPMLEGPRTDEVANPSGQFSGFFPLQDGSGRFLASWSPCRLVPADQIDLPEEDMDLVICTEERIASGDYVRADPVYGLWLHDPANNNQRPLVLPVEGYRHAEAVVMMPRAVPADLEPLQPEGEAASLAAAGYAIIDVRSVYDLDGEDISPAGLAATADPVQTPVAERAARFVRVEKAVSIPSPGIQQVPGWAYGVSDAQGMREILGYVPVEPDGSVRFAVPASVAFALTVLDSDGRRISERHQNWLQAAAGETLRCNGCHSAASRVPHGRPEAEPESINPGAATTGLPFPNSNPALTALLGETMAQTRARILGTRRLTAAIEFTDEWTDEALASPGSDILLAYADLATQSPVTSRCEETWGPACRAVIHYETHIHPLWGLPRPVFDDDGITELPDEDRTCTTCHGRLDDQGRARNPDAGLDLSDGASAVVSQQFRAYRELLVDNSVMSAQGSLASSAFTDIFASGGSHEGFLSPAELKMISEWLDLGAQYFNDPFVVPQD